MPNRGAGSRRTRPTQTQLRAFVALCDTPHFGAAAATLGVSQPTLSQALAGLEATLGVQLVERSTRHVLVTPAGARLLPFARRVVEDLEAFVDAAARDRGPLVGPLRLGIIPTAAPYLLPAVLPLLARCAPHLEPRLQEQLTVPLLDRLATGAVDVACVALPGGAASTVEIPLYDEDFVMIVPERHPWAGRTDLRPEELADVPLLLLEEGHCLRDQALEVCRHAGVRREGGGAGDAAQAASLPTIVQLVAAGMGVTLVPASAVAMALRRGPLAAAHFADPAPGRRMGLVHRASSARGEDYRALARIVLRGVARAGVPVRPLPQRDT